MLGTAARRGGHGVAMRAMKPASRLGGRPMTPVKPMSTCECLVGIFSHLYVHPQSLVVVSPRILRNIISCPFYVVGTKLAHCECTFSLPSAVTRTQPCAHSLRSYRVARCGFRQQATFGPHVDCCLRCWCLYPATIRLRIRAERSRRASVLHPPPSRPLPLFSHVEL